MNIQKSIFAAALLFANFSAVTAQAGTLEPHPPGAVILDINDSRFNVRFYHRKEYGDKGEIKNEEEFYASTKKQVRSVLVLNPQSKTGHSTLRYTAYPRNPKAPLTPQQEFEKAVKATQCTLDDWEGTRTITLVTTGNYHQSDRREANTWLWQNFEIRWWQFACTERLPKLNPPHYQKAWSAKNHQRSLTPTAAPQ